MLFLKAKSVTDGAALVDLLRQASQGERSAFVKLYERTAPKLFAVIRRICTSEDMAQEVLQESYISIWKNAASFDPMVASPITWMARIARNKAIDTIRLQSERISYLSGELDLEAASFDADPLATALKNEDLRRLTECLQGLAQERREMITLAYYRGFSREELSARFNHPVNTVKTMLRRGLAQLKECLDRHD